MQLLVYVIPYFEHLAKEEGEDGRKKINQYTRYGTVLIGALQALGISFMLERYQIVVNPGWGFKLMALITLTAGTAFIMWLGEQMTARGIGNGISILITAVFWHRCLKRLWNNSCCSLGKLMMLLRP
jgi:preprotein translocase subunit SecY